MKPSWIVALMQLLRPPRPKVQTNAETKVTQLGAVHSNGVVGRSPRSHPVRHALVRIASGCGCRIRRNVPQKRRVLKTRSSFGQRQSLLTSHGRWTRFHAHAVRKNGRKAINPWKITQKQLWEEEAQPSMTAVSMLRGVNAAVKATSYMSEKIHIYLNKFRNIS